MISHEYRCIHIHIPKCAGTSIETALGHYRDSAGRVTPDHRTIRRMERPFLVPRALSSKENSMELLRRLRHPWRRNVHPRNKLTVTRAQFDSYFKFAFVRNPWARAYSWYWNVMRNKKHRQSLGLDSEMSFDSFLRRSAGRDMLQPQTFWLKNFEGEIALDFVGRFETLEDDFETCCRRMGMAPISLPHRRKSGHGCYRDAYDKALMTLVAETYREEIEMFGYSF